MKFFLSHSSSDKHIVEKIYAQLGAAICHYDVATFDNTSFLPEQIYEALNESTHFILFASKKALASNWVKGELKTAFGLWMKSQIRQAMVFLIDDGERSEVPGWLQDYVIIEHPSTQHIACRILSAFDEWEKLNGKEPPFYRYSEALDLEKKVTVTPNNTATTIMICGTDGYGRKQLINELYRRRFSGVARRKLHISLDEHDSDVNFYRHLIGTLSLLSPIELSKRTADFIALNKSERDELISSTIIEATDAGQLLFLDVGVSGLDDSGKISSWLEGVISALPSCSYPRLILISARKPVFIPPQLTSKMHLQKLDPLPHEESKLLFSWWLNSLNVQDSSDVSDNFIEYVEGRPKSIEMAARTLATVEPSQLLRQKINIAQDLQTQASVLLKDFADNHIANIAMALVAYSGHISEVDLTEALKRIPAETEAGITRALTLLISYGFLIQDSISIRLPGYLNRVARDILNSPAYAEVVKLAIEYLISANSDIDLNEKTSVSTIEDFCIAKLRSGQHSIIGIESLILPSQCFRLAKKYYDDQDYEKSFQLCEIAYRNRLALTDDSALEVLRFKGLSAARINKQAELADVLSSFSHHQNSVKARRLHAFIKGFNLRLSGRFDDALKELTISYNSKGEGDIHILRELSFLHFSSGDIDTAEKFIRTAHSSTDNNMYIIQMLIRVLLARGKTHAIFDEDYIFKLIKELESSQRRSRSWVSSMVKAEFYFTIDDIAAAEAIIDGIPESSAVKILKSKIQIKEGKYNPAREQLARLKATIMSSHEGQRQTSLPEVCDCLVKASTSISLADGLQELDRNIRFLPEKTAQYWRDFFIQELAYSQVSATSAQRRLLGLS
ncbi:toll/interleukin-1 receptor domain-containing protein [Pseudomonas paraglycinae]|uniref:toll/interleukin-1 receptor domain-containing protein n=1 Tax=Pseudomonas paraglycinae TaxID=2892330 RepID=UPI001F188821|nr:toll/interleukin-1 receptor domain-containing protein [Pseudomonas paraglycinae]